MAQLAAQYLSGEWKSEVRIGGFDLSLRQGLVIENIYLGDQHGETLFSAKTLAVKPGRFSMGKHRVNVRKVLIDKGIVQLLTHRGDSSLNLQPILDYFASSDTTASTDTTSSTPWHLSFSAVSLKDTRFHFQDKNEPLEPVGMDYSNIDVSRINLDLTDVFFDGDTIHANIKHLAAHERSGFRLHNLSGEFQVGPAFLKAHNLKIQTPHSDLSLTFDFLYDRWNAYSDFLNAVTIQTKIEPSYLDLQDIGYFAPELLAMKDRIRLSGDIRGKVSNFKARNLRLAYGRNTFFFGDVSALGLPNIEETFIDLNIKSLNTNKNDIESFLLPGENNRPELPGMLSNIGVVSIRGLFTGFYNDFVANARIATNLGKLVTDLTLKKQKGSPLIAYNGKLAIHAFDMGKLLDQSSLLGAVTMQAVINGKGFTLGDADLTLNAHIDSVYMNHYNYRNIDLNGDLTEKKFDGAFSVRDTNLQIGFIGLIDMADTLPEFDFSARIDYAQLYNLHLLDRDSAETLTAGVTVDFCGTGLDNIEGSIHIDSLTYNENGNLITMDHCSLVTMQDTASGKSYHLRSDFINADVSGSFSFKQLIPSLSLFIKNYIASFTMRGSLDTLNEMANQVMNYKISFLATDELTRVFVPFLRIAPHAYIQGSYNEEKGTLVMTGESPFLQIYGIELNNWQLEAENVKDNLSVQTGCSTLFLKKADQKDSLEVKVEAFQMVSNLRQDSVHFGVSWNKAKIRSDFEGFLCFRNIPDVEFRLTRFHAFLGDKFWNLDTANRVFFDTARIRLANVFFHSDDQYLNLNGEFSSLPGDTLRIDFNKINISEIDKLVGNPMINIDGLLSGSILLTNPEKKFSALSNLRVDRLKLNGELLGDAGFDLTYDDYASRFDLVLKIMYTGNAGTNLPLALSGSYYMAGEHPHFVFELVLKNLGLKMIAPFVADFMSGINGLVSGKVRITGTPEKPVMTGKVNLMRTEFKINYLNVPYSLADVVTIDTNAFIFNNITLYDSLGNKSWLNGRITHRYFKDFNLGLKLELKDFAAFKNTRAQNSVFYGQARGTGNVTITGDPANIKISVKASTGGNTQVVIPIDLTESIGQTDYIVFVNPSVDTTEGAKTRMPKKDNSGLTLDLGLRVTPDAQVDVFLPNQLGNLRASGNGNLVMGMTPTTPFTLAGTYTISKGSFLFTFRNILRLPMQISEGSNINWTGDPADANVSVSAVYKTKAPLKGLTVNPEEEGIRIPVECIIRLTGKLLNPDISFGINLPNAAEDIRSLVYSSIDTTNATVMNEQTIYLLVMNQFKPVVGTSGSGVDVGSTGMSLLTNQFNSWLSAVSQNVNVNVNYKMATATTAQEFDVGISTQLFDDRLLIDGTFGMNSYNNATVQQSSTIVGDINIQYILTRNRRWRVHAYNRTNTLNILYNNAPYTQGVGLTYQRDFTNFADLFKRAKKVDVK